MSNDDFDEESGKYISAFEDVMSANVPVTDEYKRQTQGEWGDDTVDVHDKVKDYLRQYERLQASIEFAGTQRDANKRLALVAVEDALGALEMKRNEILSPYDNVLENIDNEAMTVIASLAEQSEALKKKIDSLASKANHSVKGDGFDATYYKPGFEYDKAKLDGLAEAVPAIRKCGKPTPPKFILRRHSK